MTLAYQRHVLLLFALQSGSLSGYRIEPCTSANNLLEHIVLKLTYRNQLLTQIGIWSSAVASHFTLVNAIFTASPASTVAMNHF
jgi:hypothetical protein